MTDTPIPLVDLGLQRDRISDEVKAGFDRVMQNTSFILGPEASVFEEAYAAYCGTEYCVGVGNGTDAIELALRALRIGPGDEVITVANTFIATAEAILRTGADLVLVDCDQNFLIDADQVAAAISPRTKAIVPVHLYGQLAPMRQLLEIAGDRIHVVEDAAQSQGAIQDGRRSGSLGIAAATSFYPGKNLGAYGDAGAVTTTDDIVATRLRELRNHGGVHKYEHLEIGVNSRLDGLQAVVLAAKLKRLDEWNDERRAAAGAYEELLGSLLEVRRPSVVDGNEHVWHLYVIRVPRRDDVVAALNAAAIGAGIHYPLPVHKLPAFAGLTFRTGGYPVAESLAAEILSLPIYPGITESQQLRIVAELRKAMAG
jgi:dTDP-4-amino-4,6-dideoxygalactose transaminase